MEKWIIYLAILVVAVIVFYIVRNKIKKQKIVIEVEDAKKKMLEKQRIIDIFYKRLSVNKKEITKADVAIVSQFEYNWCEESPYFYHLCYELKFLEMISVFLRDRKKSVKETQYTTSHEEIMAYSKLFLQNFISKARKDKDSAALTDFWTKLLSENYKNHEVNRADFDLYSEMIIEDLKSISDQNSLLNTITSITAHFSNQYLCDKLLSSEHCQNVVLGEKKRREEELQTTLEAFKLRGVIDQEFLTYIKVHTKKDERLIIQKAFDEVAFNEVMSKFFPGQDCSQIKPEFITILAQAYSGFTLKLLE